ncbi:RibD family protein [Paenibacillus tarimensis]
MNRPYVIMNMFSSIDGRITTSPDRNVSEWAELSLDGDANRLTHELFDELDCDGLISGSETIVVFGRHDVKLTKEIIWPQKSKAFIVFDGRGRIEWTEPQGLLVVTRENVAESYIEQLKNKNIPYVSAGNGENIDIEKALEKLYELGFRRIGLTGGGVINGAFLRKRLIDEISIIYAPVIVGGRRTPTLFDCDDLTGPEYLTRLELLKTKQLGNGTIWAHYKVMN